jgi:hypothetical protein
MKRRKFFETLGLGSAAAVVSAPAVVTGTLKVAAAENDASSHDHQGHDDRPLSGPLANATVGFGAWQSKDDEADPPQNTELDRYPNNSPATRNSHSVLPFVTAIAEGGSVNFVIAGLHQVIVYAPGKTPDDVQSNLTRPTTGTPAGVPLINDPNGRVFAGLDPSTQPRDRVEVVQFPTRGLHLVICGVQGHFLEGMFGYVRVLPRN